MLFKSLDGHVPPRFGRGELQELSFEEGGPLTYATVRGWAGQDLGNGLPFAPDALTYQWQLGQFADVYWADYALLALPLKEPPLAPPPEFVHSQDLTYTRRVVCLSLHRPACAYAWACVRVRVRACTRGASPPLARACVCLSLPRLARACA